MYIEKIKDNDVFLSMPEESKYNKNISGRDVFKLTSICMGLGAKNVKTVEDPDDVQDKIVFQLMAIKDYGKEYMNKIQMNSKICFNVFYDKLNKAYALEEIWSKGKKVGFVTYSEDEIECQFNDILKEEPLNYFEVEFKAFDFSVSGKDIEYTEKEDGTIERVDS